MIDVRFVQVFRIVTGDDSKPKDILQQHRRPCVEDRTAMKLLLGCIADDYTGASDLASVLRGAGLDTIQVIGVPAADFRLPDVLPACGCRRETSGAVVDSLGIQGFMVGADIAPGVPVLRAMAVIIRDSLWH